MARSPESLLRLRKKFAHLKRKGVLYDQIHGPKLIGRNFALDRWTTILGSFFLRHGKRNPAEQMAQRLLRSLYWDTRGRRTLSWLLPLRPNHLRPDFLYALLRQRFPPYAPEAERRRIAALSRKLGGRSEEQRRLHRLEPLAEESVTVHRLVGLLQETFPASATVTLERVHQRWLGVWWYAPRRLFGSPSYPPLLPLGLGRRRRRMALAPLRPSLPLRPRWGGRWGGGRWRSVAAAVGPRPRQGFGRRGPRPAAAGIPPASGPVPPAAPPAEGENPSAVRRWRNAFMGRRSPQPVLEGGQLRTVPQWAAEGSLLWSFWNRIRRQVALREGERVTLLRLPPPLPVARNLERSRWGKWAAERRQEGFRRRREHLSRSPEAKGRAYVAEMAALGRGGGSPRERVQRERERSEERRRLLALARSPSPKPPFRRRLLAQALERDRRERAAQLAAAAAHRRWAAENPVAAAKLRRRQAKEQERLAKEEPLWRISHERWPILEMRHRRPYTLYYDRRLRRSFSPVSRWRRPEGGSRPLRRLWPLLESGRWQRLRRLCRWDRRWRSARRHRSPSLRALERQRELERQRGLRELGALVRSGGSLAEALKRRGPLPLQRPRLRFRSRWFALRWLALRRQRSRPGLRRWQLRTNPLGRRLRSRDAAHRVGYRVVELNLVDLSEEETRHGPGERWLLVQRYFPKGVGYGDVLADLFSLLTPALKLQVKRVGHKSTRRTAYSVRSGVALERRVRTIFGWLKTAVNKNPDFDHLRRNVERKPPSKRVRLKPERSNRLTTPLRPRLAAEFHRLVGLDPETTLSWLEDHDEKTIGAPLVVTRHFRWAD